jgi:hypothetical protein
VAAEDLRARWSGARASVLGVVVASATMRVVAVGGLLSLIPPSALTGVQGVACIANGADTLMYQGPRHAFRRCAAPGGWTRHCHVVPKTRTGSRQARVAETMSFPPAALSRARAASGSRDRLGDLRGLQALGALRVGPWRRLCSGLPG